MTDNQSPLEPNQIQYSKRRFARLLAIQSLYQKEQTNDSVDKIMNDTMKSLPSLQEDMNGEPDIEFFGLLLNGADQNQAELDDHIQNHLTGWDIRRLDSVLRALLRASFYEILYIPTVPTSVIINEYLELAKGFFPAKEVGFINAALDRFSKKVRE
jgi:N utilization substance protein B